MYWPLEDHTHLTEKNRSGTNQRNTNEVVERKSALFATHAEVCLGTTQDVYFSLFSCLSVLISHPSIIHLDIMQ